MFDCHNPMLTGSSALDSFYNRDSGEYVFKRDPDSFQRILNYYHTGKLHLPKNECVARFDSIRLNIHKILCILATA